MLQQRQSRVAPPPRECALSACVRYLRGAWTPNILWHLKGPPRRFSELRKDVAGISSKVLAQRLQRMTEDGLVLRVSRQTSPPSVEYALSELGRELAPALDVLVAVGGKIKRRAQSRELLAMHVGASQSSTFAQQ